MIKFILNKGCRCFLMKMFKVNHLSMVFGSGESSFQPVDMASWHKKFRRLF